MSQLDLMKLFSQYEGEISLSDFTPQELQEYLDFVKDNDAPLFFRREKRKRPFCAYGT